MHFKLASVLVLAATTTAHFVLQIPTDIGFDDDNEPQAPCGSFDPTNRTAGVTDWPSGGSSVQILTTHTQALFQINAALLSDVNNWVPLWPLVQETGVGTFCWPDVPGIANWVNQDGVLQVVMNGPDGILYQVSSA